MQFIPVMAKLNFSIFSVTSSNKKMILICWFDA